MRKSLIVFNNDKKEETKIGEVRQSLDTRRIEDGDELLLKEHINVV